MRAKCPKIFWNFLFFGVPALYYGDAVKCEEVEYLRLEIIVPLFTILGQFLPNFFLSFFFFTSFWPLFIATMGAKMRRKGDSTYVGKWPSVVVFYECETANWFFSCGANFLWKSLMFGGK